jgi:hypothetical protein
MAAVSGGERLTLGCGAAGQSLTIARARGSTHSLAPHMRPMWKQKGILLVAPAHRVDGLCGAPPMRARGWPVGSAANSGRLRLGAAADWGGR